MKHLTVCLVLLFISCAQPENRDPLQIALESEAIEIRRVMSDLDQYEVQIKLSTIHQKDDLVRFTDYDFQVDDDTYFYPASTVKFPASVLTLEKLNRLNHYALDTPFYVEGDSTETTFKHDIQDIFAVSSNDTYNRLFEFLGKDYMNNRMKELDLVPVQFSHRLETDDAANLVTRPLVFKINDSTLTTTESVANTEIEPLQLNKVRKGHGFYREGMLVNEPMDFSEKNYLPISTLHDLMKRVIFPEAFPSSKRFDISDEQHQFLMNSMALVPRDLGYDPVEYYDGYGKFFLFGDTTNSIPPHMKVYNKVGYAYGYLTDCAYITDSKNDIHYILTATIHVNSDGIFNDDIYEYETVGIPFLAQLGREIHDHLIEQQTK